MNAPRTWVTIAALLLLAGCPDPSGKSGEGAVVESATAAGPTSGTPAAPTDPLAGSVFSRDDVLELFRAEHAAGADPSPANEAERRRLLAKHRLVDDEGREVIARVRAYDRAVQALAEDTEAWAAFVESLPR